MSQTNNIRPIRPTTLIFNDDAEVLEFIINYATSSEITNSEGMERTRQMMRNHKPAKRRGEEANG